MIDVTGIKQKKEKDLTLKGHLVELRRRLIWSVVAVVITTAISFAFARRIFDFLESRAPGPEEGVTIIFVEVTEMIGTYMKVCLYSGVVLALPFIIYQIVMFVRPALTRQEKTYLYLLMPGVLLFFAAGAAFGYIVFLPRALDFLLNFPWLNSADPYISIGNYISVVTRLLLAMGLIFELPLVMFFLSKIGVVSPQGLSRFRKFAIVGAFIVAAIVTPTPDPVNQTIVAIPIILLYEVGILLAKLARRQAPAPAESQA